MVKFVIKNKEDEDVVEVFLEESGGCIDICATYKGQFRYIMGIKPNGTLCRYTGISVMGFERDSNGRIKLDE